MSDYDSIKETVFNYCEGYRNQDLEKLEKAFALARISHQDLEVWPSMDKHRCR